MTLLTLQAVTRSLKGSNLDATLEYPGIISIKSPQTGTAWLWGDANETFDADVYEVPIEEGTPTRTITTDIPSDCADVALIANTVLKAYAEDSDRFMPNRV